MVGPTVQEDVVIDADSRALYAAMATIEQRLKTIGGAVTKIMKDAENGGKNFDKTIDQTMKNLMKAQSSLSALASINNTPSGRIQDLNSNRSLARQTLEATKYARELNVARNATEALEAKIASLNKTVAARGAAGGFATIAQTDQLQRLQKASTLLKQLDRDFEKMQTSARRLGSTDLTAEIRAVAEARSKLFAAASNTRRSNVGPEVLGVSDAQAALAERIATARREETAALANSFRIRKELAVADAAGTKEVETLERARIANAQRIAEYRRQLKDATGTETTKLFENLEIEKAIGAQLRRNTSEVERAAKASAAGAGQAAAPGKTGLAKYLPNGGLAAVGIRTLAYGGAAGVAFGAVNEVKQGLEFASSFEDELAKLQAIADATDYQMQRLKASILDVGASSRFSVLDLTKISQTLAQAGVSAGDMTKVLKSVTTLATSSGSTPDEAVNLVTGALGSFQLQATESARVADLMTTALNRTKLTVGQVGQAIQYVGATAYEQNVSLEELLATIGAMAQAGVRSGSTIGTGLRQLLVDLQSPSKNLTEQLKAVGLTIADVNVAVHGEAQVIETLKTAGFGAAQAYAGLETRAAAAYLVLKNNVDVMDNLKLAFAEQGSSAKANERAMDSLSAQWQRFKNIISGALDGPASGLIGFFKDAVKGVSDLIEVTEQYNRMPKGTGEKLADATAKTSLGAAAGATLGGTLGAGVFGVGAVPGAAIGGLAGGYIGALSAARDGQQKVTISAADMATKIADGAEAAEKQRGKISEVDEAIQRLITQHASYDGHSTRTTAETVTLMSKFEGLSKYLVGATGNYESLINAMQRYRTEAAGTLTTILNGQIAAQGQAKSQALQAGVMARGRVWSNTGLMSQLSAAERNALSNPRDPANADLITRAGERTGNNDLRELARQVGLASQASAEQRVATEQLNATMTQTTKSGQSLTDRAARAEAMLQELGGLEGKARTDRAGEARRLAKSVVDEANQRLARTKPGDRPVAQLQEWAGRGAAVMTGIDAALAPSKEEAKAAAAAAREAAKQPKISQSDIDGLGKAMGLALGSGQRSAAEQNALFRAGKTTATAETSGHSQAGGVARDFRTGGISDEQGARLEAAAKKYYADRGITGLYVKYESGKGGKNGTGPHLHVSGRPGARKSGPESDGQDRFDAQRAIDTDQTQVDQKTFNTALKNIRGASSQSQFGTVVDGARTALDKLNADITTNALNDLAKLGLIADPANWDSSNNPTIRAKADQVKDAIEQNSQQFQQAIADGMISAVDKQVKAAKTAFDLSMKPFDDRVATAQGNVTGLGLYSNRFAPDYTNSLAQSRVAQAQETQVRARAASLPTLIANTSAAIGTFQQQINTSIGTDGNKLSGDSLVSVKLKLEELTKSLADLGTEKQNLDAQLAAGASIPDTLSGGLQQAIANYEQAHNLTQSFKQDVISNLGGAVDTVANSINDLFTGILTGSQTALGAFASFAKGIMQYIQQMVAKMIASKILSLLFSIGASAFGGATSKGGLSSGLAAGRAGAGDTSTLTNSGDYSFGFDGGLAGSVTSGPMRNRFATGGMVMNGSSAYDSVNAKLAKGEWVVNKRAVDSVGNDFMAQLNKNGAGALKGMQAVPVLPPPAQQNTNVWVVKPDQQPTMSRNDVLVTINEDILSGGETKKLIRHVANGG